MKARGLSTVAPKRTTPRTRSATDLRALILSSLTERRQTFRTQLKRCQKRYSEEAVHDLRVATRRLIASLDLVASIFPEGKWRKARRALKRQLDMLGPLRDIQVQLRSVDKMLPSYPELQGFYDSQIKRERKLVQRLGTAVKTVKTNKVEKAIHAATLQVDVDLGTAELQREKRAEAIRAVEEAFGRVVERKQTIDPADSASIHRMRVAFKKFRYMVESLAPMLDGVTSRRLKQMNAFQGQMGDIQDVEVLFTSVNTFGDKAGAATAVLLVRPLQELSNQRAALVNAFMKSADRLYSFWKPTS